MQGDKAASPVWYFSRMGGNTVQSNTPVPCVAERGKEVRQQSKIMKHSGKIWEAAKFVLPALVLIACLGALSEVVVGTPPPSIMPGSDGSDATWWSYVSFYGIVVLIIGGSAWFLARQLRRPNPIKDLRPMGGIGTPDVLVLGISLFRTGNRDPNAQDQARYDPNTQLDEACQHLKDCIATPETAEKVFEKLLGEGKDESGWRGSSYGPQLLLLRDALKAGSLKRLVLVGTELSLTEFGKKLGELLGRLEKVWKFESCSTEVDLVDFENCYNKVRDATGSAVDQVKMGSPGSEPAVVLDATGLSTPYSIAAAVLASQKDYLFTYMRRGQPEDKRDYDIFDMEFMDTPPFLRILTQYG